MISQSFLLFILHFADNTGCPIEFFMSMRICASLSEDHSPSKSDDAYIPLINTQEFSTFWRQTQEDSLDQIAKRVFAYVQLGNLENLKRTIQRNPKLEIRSLRDSNEWTVLHYACWFGNFEIFDFLVSEMKLIQLLEIREATGMNPLHCACQKAQFRIVEKLLAISDEKLWQVTDRYGKKPAEYAGRELKKLIQSHQDN